MPASPLISAPELAGRLGSNCRVFDCRFDLADTSAGHRAYLAGHVPGAVYAHVDNDLSGPVSAESGRHPLPEFDHFRTWLGRNGVDRDTWVVAYDDTGGSFASRLWWMMHWCGHRRAAVLDGGFQGWVGRGLPVETSTPSLQTRQYVARADDSRWIDAAELQSGRDWCLIDVRTPERFRGEAEPIDPVAGHIPGAINIPLQRNLAANGCYLPAPELRGLYEPVLADSPAARVVCYCGSGVTACHTLLALEVAGFHGARLYAGSWSEWIRDPTRPVATGP